MLSGVTNTGVVVAYLGGGNTVPESLVGVRVSAVPEDSTIPVEEIFDETVVVMMLGC